MKKLLSSLFALATTVTMLAQGWPSNYTGVMLQGFYWDSFNDTRWTKLTQQANELAAHFDLIWIPQSGNCGGTSMGYDPLYLFNNYTSTFGNETTLRTMINTFKDKGMGTIADVVINHHKDVSNWVVFPKEVYKGTTYQFKSTDVVKNDDNGKTKTFCDANGFTLSDKNDTGEGWDGMRDLDHYSENVQKITHAYLDFLINDLGYTGVRYDMVKGYSASFTGLYNSTANLQFSVGEYWDGNTGNVQNWINGTKVNSVIQSAAFDFPFRYTARDVVNNKNWAALAGSSLARVSAMSRYSVTFIENHDTEYRSSSYPQDPIKADTLALNAFMLSMPGTPCVFLKHWQAYKEEIKNMINVRKLVGIHNQSRPTTMASQKDYFVSQIATTKSGKRLLIFVGKVPQSVIDQRSNGYVCLAKGYHYAMYVENTLESAWIDKPTGTYDNGINITLSAVCEGKQLVYSTDGGSTWTNVERGKVIPVTESCTVKAGLRDGSNVVGIVERTYEIKKVEPFDPYKATVYVKDPTAAPYNWTSVYCWAWDDNTTLTTSKSWPGDVMTESKVVKGDKFFYRAFDITSKDYTFNFIFSQKGKPQTIDFNDINKDVYLELGEEMPDGKYDVKDVTDKYTSSGGEKGDVNGDGVVDITDVNILLNIILGFDQASNYDGRADVDGNGDIDISDVNETLNIILKLS